LQEISGINNKPYSKKQELVFEFQNLVTNCFIKHKQVGEYAERLNVSANSLNQAVKEILGKTAKEIISERIIEEAKKQLNTRLNSLRKDHFEFSITEIDNKAAVAEINFKS
jgi:methylphosphotriester-DNA--protein-cysteine methyltransferase